MATMKARGVVTDDEGKSRFEEREVSFADVADVTPGGVFHAAALGPSDVAMVRFAPGFECDFHHTPAPTWMFVMQGRMEIELSDGAKEVIAAGDAIHLTDHDGQGHRSRVLGDEAVLVATAGYGG